MMGNFLLNDYHLLSQASAIFSYKTFYALARLIPQPALA